MEILLKSQAEVKSGDIIEFSHNGSHGEGNCYLICCSNQDGYFIVNLSGKKNGKVKFYGSLNVLLKFHKDSITKIYSQEEWALALTRKQN